MWIIPGAALEDGKGWRLWYSKPGEADFTPPAVVVRRPDGHPEAVEQTWQLLPALAGLGRRMGVRQVVRAAPSGAAATFVVDPQLPGIAPLRLPALPTELPADGLTFVVGSCFWHDSDKEGHFADALKAVPAAWRPTFKLLIGDQVYLDWPPDACPDTEGRAVEICGGRYEEYWGDPAYREALASGPNFFTCDDHEFWNNYPERQPHIARSWQRHHEEYERACQTLYDLYQASANPGGRRWFRFRTGGVSFFVADTRSQRERFRSDGRAHFMPEAAWKDLEAWGRALTGPGVLVLGQPIFQEEGKWTDHALSNFTDDYDRLWRVIEATTAGQGTADGRPHDILVISGDIHTGRISVGRNAVGASVYELICSPSSMISPGKSSYTQPPTRFSVGRVGHQRPWTVDVHRFLTLDNHMGLVRLRPGTNGRVAVDLGFWRIRPFDDRKWWERPFASRPGRSFAFLPLPPNLATLQLR